MATRTSLFDNLTEAIDSGDFPNVASGDKEQQVSEPMGTDPNDGYAEVRASSEYQKAATNLSRYLGRRITDEDGNPMGIMGQMMQILQQVKGVENDNKEKLEQLAIRGVLAMPEFSDAKAAYENGELGIVVELLTSAQPLENKETVQELEDEPEFESDLEQIAFEIADLDQEKAKRHFANVVTQGLAVRGFWGFENEDLTKELDSMQSDLTEKYGLFSGLALMMNWVFPSIPGSPVADSDVEYDKEDEEGNSKPTVKARAPIFPLLLHELVKGLAELVAQGALPQDAQTAKHAISVDTWDNEILGMLVGGHTVDRLKTLVGSSNESKFFNVIEKLYQMDAIDPEVDDDDVPIGFAKTVQYLLDQENPTRAQKTMDRLIQQVDNELEDYYDEVRDQY